MGKKITYEYVRSFIEKTGCKLITKEYKNSKTKMSIVYPNKHTFQMHWNSFNTGYRCPECAGNKRITYEKIKDKVLSIEGYRLITTKEDIGKLNYLKKFYVECNQGHRYETDWKRLRSGRRCPVCANKCIDIEYIRNFIKEERSGFRLLSNEYVSADVKLDLLCPDGHRVYMSWRNFRAKKGCATCRNLKLRKIKASPEDDLINYFVEHGYKFDKWLNGYVNQKSKCLLLCPEGHEYTTTFDSFFQGNRCYECYLDGLSGSGSHSWKGGITSIHLYLRGKLSEWKRLTREKYNGRCDISGQEFEEIHHLYSFNKILKETFEISGIPIKQTINEYSVVELNLLTETIIDLHNKYGLGVCLTKEVHREFHSIYGYDNNHEQYYEFKEYYLADGKNE